MKLMVILPRVPWPLEKGDKLRAFHLIRCLSEKHDITLVALYQGTLDADAKSKLAPYCKRIIFFKLSLLSITYNIFVSFFKGLPLQSGYFYRRNIHKKIIKLANEIEADAVFFQLIRSARYAEGIAALKLLDYQDALSLGLERRAQLRKGLARFILSIEAKRTKRFERLVFKQFDHHFIISEQDRAAIDIQEKEQIQILPNGVDLEHYCPEDQEPEYDLLFVGNMNYPPNVNAMEFMCVKVLPLLLKDFPKLQMVIAGASPSSRVRSLASDNVIVTGWVDDLRIYYSRSKVFVAPMQIGTGLQNKLLEAMAMKLACVTTTLSNNAIGAQNGQQILVAESPEAIAKAIYNLLTDESLRHKVAESGRVFVESRFSWNAQTNIINKHLL